MDMDEYVRSLKNADKRAYAAAYAKFLRASGEEPARPRALSTLAAQAVRMRLHEMFNKAPKAAGQHDRIRVIMDVEITNLAAFESAAIIAGVRNGLDEEDGVPPNPLYEILGSWSAENDAGVAIVDFVCWVPEEEERSANVALERLGIPSARRIRTSH